GIVLGGRRDGRMIDRYYKDSNAPIDECTELHSQRAGPTCQFVRGDGVDAAVAGLFLEAIQPAQLEVALATLEDLEAQARQVERQWQVRLGRIRYEAGLARGGFLGVWSGDRAGGGRRGGGGDGQVAA